MEKTCWYHFVRSRDEPTLIKATQLQVSVTNGATDCLLSSKDMQEYCQIYFHFILPLPHFSHKTKCKFRHLICEKKHSRIAKALFKVKLRFLAMQLGKLFLCQGTFPKRNFSYASFSGSFPRNCSKKFPKKYPAPVKRF